VRGLTKRGEALRARGDHDGAVADLSRALVAAASAAQKAPASAEWQVELATAHFGLARCLHGRAADETRATAELGVARDLISRLAGSGRLSAEYRELASAVRAGL